MITIEFTEEQVEQLAYERFYHPHPRVQRKMEALLLKAKEFSHQEICDVVGCTANTLRSWLRAFQQDGVAGLQQWKSGGSTSELEPHLDDICDYLAANPPHTIAEARQAIETLTGIKRSLTQVRLLLKRLGFRRLKTGSLPAKADFEAQAAFKKKSLSLV